MKELPFDYMMRKKRIRGLQVLTGMILKIYMDIESNICYVCRGTLHSKTYAFGDRSSQFCSFDHHNVVTDASMLVLSFY
jgi:hypothetical protein